MGLRHGRTSAAMTSSNGEGGTAKLDMDPAAADGDGQTVGNLQPPQGGHDRAFVNHLLEQRPDRIRRFVAINPRERCRTIEDQAHGRPSSRKVFHSAQSKRPSLLCSARARIR